jgi:phenylacetate-CoA ligase
VDESGRPCGPGETGKVVATALHNYATPLIRYEIGDYAEVGDACPCGRGLPVLNRVVGRVRNMLTLPNGKRFWPSLGDSGYTDVAPIEQFQFIQKTLEDIEIKLVARRPLTREEDQNLRTLIWSRLGHPFNLTFSYHTEIPRSAGGKYEDFKSELVS